MKKSGKFSLCLLTFITLCNTVDAQLFDAVYKTLDRAKYLVYYQEIAKKDSTHRENKSKSTKLLLIGDSISKFVDNGLFRSDTIVRKFNDWSQLQEFSANPDKPKMSSIYMIFKNHPKGETVFSEYLMPDYYTYKENLSDFNWLLVGDTLTINGYLCQKAGCYYGGREWVAWFCPQIPINDGPYKFCGLPGLIIQISDSKNDYVFTLQSITACENPIVIDWEEKAYITTTRKDFLKAQYLSYQNFESVMKDKVTTDNPVAVKRKMASRNNPIELDMNK